MFCFVLVGLAGGARSALAAARTWDAGGDGLSWSDKNNWSANTVPANNDTVTIASGTVSVDVNTKNLTSLTISGGTVTVSGSSTINITGTGTNLFSVTGGTFTGGSGTISDNGALSISGSANFTASSGSTSIGGSFSKAGTGTFSANGGTVTLTGSGSITGATGTNEFNKLTISGSYTLGGDLKAGSNLSLSGSLDTSSHGLSVGGTLGVGDSVTYAADPTLVGYWAFDDAAHTLDSSGNGNALTWTGSPSFPTTNLPSLVFDPTNAFGVAMTNQTSNAAARQFGATAKLSTICTTSVPALCPATVSLAAWYKATSTDKVASEIVSGSNTYGLRITSSGLVVMKRIGSGTSADWIEYQVPFSGVLDGNWHQIIGVIVTGTGGGMTAYLDGAPAAGNYFIGGTTTQLDSTTTPTASAAATAAIDWTDSSATESAGLAIGYNPSGATGYNFGANFTSGSTSKKCGSTDSTTTSICAIDDVRIYNRALTAADVTALSKGNGTGGSSSVLTLSGASSVTGNATVNPTGTLTLASGSSLTMGSGATLAMNGTLNATGGTIQGAGSYTFQVGSVAAAAPELNVDGLTIENTELVVNADSAHASDTTFTRFDNVTFGSGTGTELLQIYASNLYLSSNGCTFDGSTTYAVKLTAVGTGANPRALFGNATCGINVCANSEKEDDDSDNDGVPDPDLSTSTGAVVQFIRSARSDTGGTLVGFPTAAFNWNDFSYYSTYVTFHDLSGGGDVVYVRGEDGSPLYSWTDPTPSETIVGTPQWTTTTGGTHYLYVATNGSSSNGGKVYRLIDNTSSKTLTVDTTWKATTGGASNGVFSCVCTVTSDLSLDGNNVYWAATTGTGTPPAQMLFGIQQADGTKIKTGWPATAPAGVTTSAPTLVTVGTTTSLYLGATSTLAQLNFTTVAWMQDVPSGIGTINGRVSYGNSLLPATSGTLNIFAGDTSGSVWAINPSSFSSSGTVNTFRWKYPAGSTVTDNYYDAGTDTVQFGTSGGAVVVLTGAGSGTNGAVLNAGYPYALPGGDPVSAAPLYYNGVLVVGTSRGNLYFLDRDNGGGVSILKEVNFGPTESVSTVGFDPAMSRYLVATSSPANDGRIYDFDLVSDPTPSNP